MGVPLLGTLVSNTVSIQLRALLLGFKDKTDPCKESILYTLRAFQTRFI